MRIEFGELQRKQAASLIAFPAFLVVVMSDISLGFSWLLFAGEALSVMLLAKYQENTKAVIASCASMGALAGLINNSKSNTINQAAGASDWLPVPFDLMDASFSLALMLFIGLITFVRFSGFEDWINHGCGSKFVRIVANSSIYLMTTFLILFWLLKSKDAWMINVIMIAFLPFVGRYKQLTVAYAVISFVVLSGSLLL